VGGELETGEPPQLAQGLARGRRIGEVQLGHVCAETRTGVGKSSANDGDDLTGPAVRIEATRAYGPDPQSAEGKGRVRQAKAEREQRLVVVGVIPAVADVEPLGVR